MRQCDAPRKREAQRIAGWPSRWVRDGALNCDADLTLMATQQSGMLAELVKASGDEIRGLGSLKLKARLSATLAVELRSDLLVLGAVDCRIACI